MKTSRFPLIFYFLLFFLLPGKSQVLNVVSAIQEQDQWCWAGVSDCVLKYYCSPIIQCNIAEYTRTVATWHSFGTTNCCVNPSLGCNYWNYNWGYPGSIQDILIHFASIQNYGVGSVLSQATITTELTNNRPFIIRWGWTTGGGHFLVGHGQAGNTLYYMNPWFGEGLKIADYSWVVSGSNHNWTHTNVITTSSPRPWPAGTISGSSTVTQGQTGAVYSVAAIANATGYSWTLPTGASITAGNNTNSVVLAFSLAAQSGVLRVTGTNACGSGASTADFNLTVNPAPPATKTLTNITVLSGQTKCYNASQTIFVAGNGTSFIVRSGGSATMIAGQNIRYLPGTLAQSGCSLRGWIAPTGPFCVTPSKPVVIASQNETSPGMEKSSFKIYPNPTKGIFTLELTREPQKTPVVIIIYDLMGSVILETEIRSGRVHEFSLSSKVPGIYLIKVLHDNEIGIGKIIRQ